MLQKEGLKQAVKLVFMTEFSYSISVKLQQVERVENMSVNQILGRVRILAASGGKNKLYQCRRSSKKESLRMSYF